MVFYCIGKFSFLCLPLRLSGKRLRLSGKRLRLSGKRLRLPERGGVKERGVVK